MLVLQQVIKRYGTVTALENLNLTAHRGETLGLLGPNGAGKTTTLRLLAGLTAPTGGTVRVQGRDPWREPDAVRQMMGVLPDGVALYGRLTVAENLWLFARLFGVSRSRVQAVMDAVGIAELANRPARGLSKGERQRVGLARAFLHRPALLFLDEPTSGLDPAAAAAFHRTLRGLKGERVTVVLSSHDMVEVESLCDRVAILDRGQLMALDTPLRLKASFGRPTVVAAVETPEGIRKVEWPLDDPDLGERIAACRQMGTILSLHSTEASLAQVFMRLTGRELV